MTDVQLQTIFQSFGGQRVLNGLNLSIESGHYVVLLGESGCGKTTTLRIIAGLQPPDSGSVFLGERCIDRIPPRDRDVAMVFQHEGLYPHWTIAESIRFPIKGKVDSRELQARVEQAIELTQIGAILDRYPGRLSGGELRRAAIAKAIARHSSVRLLDEPLSALGASVRHELQDDLLRWHATVPGTSIHVTHDGQEAMRMADRIAVIEQGQVIQYATPADIFAAPETLSVANATGARPVNRIASRLCGGRIEIRNPDVICQLDCHATGPDRDVCVGVRPESLRMLPSEGKDVDADLSSERLVLTAQLVSYRPVHRNFQLQLRSGDTSLLAILPQHSFQPSETIRLVAREGIHLFEAESGRVESGRRIGSRVNK